MKTSAPPQDLRTFYRGLPSALKRKFAEEAGTTTSYMEAHLVYARKLPRKDTFDRLWKACDAFGAKFSREDLLTFFYRPEDSANA
jgi:hypothetical protein